MSTIAERVAAGAAFLDEHDPDWWRAEIEQAINLDTLELENPARCVLGQRCPLEVLANYDPRGLPDQRYFAYAHHLSGVGLGDEVICWARDLGFALGESLEAYPALTAEWARVITERRSQS